MGSIINKFRNPLTFLSAKVLMMSPILNVPGMTEFKLNEDTVLGLMPSAGIKRLLGDKLPDPDKAAGIPRAEIYLHVTDPELTTCASNALVLRR